MCRSMGLCFNLVHLEQGTDPPLKSHCPDHRWPLSYARLGIAPHCKAWPYGNGFLHCMPYISAGDILSSGPRTHYIYGRSLLASINLTPGRMVFHMTLRHGVTHLAGEPQLGVVSQWLPCQMVVHEQTPTARMG